MLSPKDLLTSDASDELSSPTVDREPEKVRHSASESGTLEWLSETLDKGIDVDHVFDDGETPLTLACKAGELDIVETLLISGADISFAQRDGFTPLMCAAQYDHFEVVKYLLANGVDIKQRTATGYSALMCSCLYGQAEYAKRKERENPEIPLKENEVSETFKLLLEKTGPEAFNHRLVVGYDIFTLSLLPGVPSSVIRYLLQTMLEHINKNELVQDDVLMGKYAVIFQLKFLGRLQKFKVKINETWWKYEPYPSCFESTKMQLERRLKKT